MSLIRILLPVTKETPLTPSILVTAVLNTIFPGVVPPVTADTTVNPVKVEEVLPTSHAFLIFKPADIAATSDFLTKSFPLTGYPAIAFCKAIDPETVVA